MLIARRNVLRGLFAMPAIVAIDHIMPIKVDKPYIILPYRGKVIFDEAFYYAPYIPVTWFAPAGFPNLRDVVKIASVV